MQMALEVRSRSILRFGIFEVDLRAGELRKQGARIKLQEQPFHVLTLLLQRPGEVVTREELRSQSWPADTFVDFDNSLNTAINKLREALGDSADNPRFIETLAATRLSFHRAGYRCRWNDERDRYRCERSRAATQSEDRRDGGSCCARSGNRRRTALARAATATSHGRETPSFSEISPIRLAMQSSMARSEKAFLSSWTSRPS